MTDIAPTTLTVTAKSDTYEFKIPTLHDDIAIGARMSKLRKAIDPSWNGFDQDLDYTTQYTLRAAATFEILLQKSSSAWPFFETPKGPIVDSSKFPTDKFSDVLEGYGAFNDALAKFRAGGDKNNAPAGEALAS